MAALAPRKLCRLCKSMEVVEGRGAARYGTLLSGTSPSRARSGRPYGTARGTMVGWNTRSPLSRDPGAAGPSSSTVWSHARGPAAPSTFRSFTPLSSSTLRRHRPSPSSETTGTSRRSYATAAADYYKVLKVPHGATRQQIKAKFYEVSGYRGVLELVSSYCGEKNLLTVHSCLNGSIPTLLVEIPPNSTRSEKPTRCWGTI